MTVTIVWGIVALYLAAGLTFARSTVRRWSRNPNSLLDQSDNTDRATAALASLALGLIWPLAMVFYALRDWLWKPADRAHERVEQMRADRDAWRATQQAASTSEERTAAAAIVDALTDLIARAEGGGT